jgi:hypothetical protein
VNPKLSRQYARDCERMAKERIDLFTHEALIELASEFRRAAEEIESGSRRRRGERAQNSRFARALGTREKIKENAAVSPRRRRLSSAR